MHAGGLQHQSSRAAGAGFNHVVWDCCGQAGCTPGWTLAQALWHDNSSTQSGSCLPTGHTNPESASPEVHLIDPPLWCIMLCLTLMSAFPLLTALLFVIRHIAARHSIATCCAEAEFRSTPVQLGLSNYVLCSWQCNLDYVTYQILMVGTSEEWSAYITGECGCCCRGQLGKQVVEQLSVEHVLDLAAFQARELTDMFGTAVGLPLPYQTVVPLMQVASVGCRLQILSRKHSVALQCD